MKLASKERVTPSAEGILVGREVSYVVVSHRGFLYGSGEEGLRARLGSEHVDLHPMCTLVWLASGHWYVLNETANSPDDENRTNRSLAIEPVFTPFLLSSTRHHRQW